MIRSTPCHVESLEVRVFLSSARLAVIGDFGYAEQYNTATPTAERDVANLVKSWDASGRLDAVVTTGDNNYPNGDPAMVDNNIGQYYHPFIYNYKGRYGAGSSTQRFLPALGNHDWDTSSGAAHLNYFTLPGNERYYDYVLGPVHLFVVDSDTREPDGTSSTSRQATWLKNGLANSTSPWNVVVTHHAPYSSGSSHGSTGYMQWPYKEWGADVVVSGHDHHYERLNVNGLPYFVNGIGGKSLRGFGSTVAGSQFRYSADFGAQLVEATDTSLSFKLYNRGGQLIDTYTMTTSGTPTTPPTTARTAVFQQGVNSYAGTTDTFLHQNTPDTSNGSSTSIKVDGDDPAGTGRDAQGLIRFDNLFGSVTGQIPAGAQITSAKLDLNVSNAGTSLQLHRMLRSWQASDTWNTLGTGIQANGTEAASTADAVTSTVPTGPLSIDVTKSLQAWAANPASNFGWAVLPTGSDGVEFASAQGTIKPKLTVTYNPPSTTPPSLPVVSLAATDASASETAGNNGQFTVSRTGGDTSKSLAVKYALSGSATNSSDYQTLSGIVTIPAGASSGTFSVVPINDTLAEGNETVIASVAADAAYQIGTGQATVTIQDNDVTTPPTTARTATFQQGVNGYAGTRDTFLHQNTPGTSNGTATSVNVDGDDPAGTGRDVQGLLRFDSLFGTGAGQIPTGAQITSARLELNVTNAGAGVQLYRMLRTWQESDTWNTLSTGIQTNGTETASTADAVTSSVPTGTLSIDVTRSLQAWATNPASNFGWAIMPTGGDGVDFSSAQGTIKPRLVVNYTA